mgnify:CR=1 FL=1
MVVNMDYPVADLSHKTNEIDLLGSGGNAYALMATGSGWLRDLGLSNLKSQFLDEMMDGDYGELLQTIDRWFNTDLSWGVDYE